MPRRMSAKLETQQAEVEREKRVEGRGGWKGGSSFSNFGTELVDESVGGYRRLSRRRATSNTEQEGSWEEKRETTEKEEESQADRRTGQRRAWKRKREEREGKRERILFLRLYRYFHGRSPLLKPVAVPGPPFPASSSVPLASYLFVTVSLVSHEPINIFFDVRRIN